MKKLFVLLFASLLCLMLMCCSGNVNAHVSTDSEKSDSAETGDFVTHDFAHFSISTPREFATTSDATSDNVRFSSDTVHVLADGSEFSSSAYIDAYFLPDGATPCKLQETATTMKLSEEAKGETCEEPQIEGNLITMRTWHASDDGDKVITWRFWLVSPDGRNVGGQIYFSDKEESFYEPMVTDIIRSVRIK